MKTNHEKLIAQIVDSIRLCGYDNALTDAKRHLQAALQSAGKIAKKRTIRDGILDQINKEAKEKQEKWWQTLKENAGKINDEERDDSATER